MLFSPDNAQFCCVLPASLRVFLCDIIGITKQLAWPLFIYIFIRQMAATTNDSESKTNADDRWTASLTNTQPRPFRIRWRQSLPKVKIYLQTKFRRHILIHRWDAIIPVRKKKQKSTVLELFFPLRFWPDHSNLHAILHQTTKFRPNRPIRGRISSMQFQDGSRRPRWCSTTSAFVFNVVTLFRSSKSIYRPNFIDISQFTAEI